MEAQTVLTLRDQWTTISLVTAWLIVHFIGGYRYRDYGFRAVWQDAFYPTAVFRWWWQSGSIKKRLLRLPVVAIWIIGQTIPWILAIWATSLLLLPLTLFGLEATGLVYRDELYQTLLLVIGLGFIIHLVYLLIALFTREDITQVGNPTGVQSFHKVSR